MIGKNFLLFSLLTPLILATTGCSSSKTVTKPSITSTLVRDSLDILMHTNLMEGDKLFLHAQNLFQHSRWSAPEGYNLEKISLDGLPLEYLTKTEEKREKLIIQFHGGAYILSLIDPYRDVAMKYTRLAPVNVLSVDYRVAPDNVFPAALEDALATWEYALSLGYAPKDIIVVGDSAGGNLTLAMTLKLRAMGKELPKALVLMSPWTDMSCSLDAHQRNFESDPIFGERNDVNPFAENKSSVFDYAGDTPLDDPYLSPYFANFKDFPPMLIQVGTHEILEDDSVLLAEKAVNDGVTVNLTRYEGMFHVFQLVPFLPESKQAWQEVEEFIEKQFRSYRSTNADTNPLSHSLYFSDPDDFPFGD